MASLVKQKGWYSAQFYDSQRRPQRKQVPLRTRTKKAAEKARRDLEDRFATGEYDPWLDGRSMDDVEVPRTLREAVEAFLESRSHRSPETIKTYGSILNRFVDLIGDNYPVDSVRACDVHRFLDSTEAGDVTRHSYRRNIRAFFRWAVKRGICSRDATADVRLKKIPSKFPQFLSRKEPHEILKAIDAEGNENPYVKPEEVIWLKPIVRLTVLLGLRLGEVCSLRWSEVDLEHRLLEVVSGEGFTTKNGKDRVIPIPDEAQKIFKDLDRARPSRNPQQHVFKHSQGSINRLYLSKRFCKFRRKAGLPESITFHSLRHTTASWLVMNGASLEAVRQYLGHSSIQVTQKYAHLSPNVYHSQIRLALHTQASTEKEFTAR